MDFKELVSVRRAYRKIEPITVTDELIKDLVETATLAPSCNNNQPWRFVFIYDKDRLGEVQAILHEKNEWAKQASLLVGVFSKPDLDCQIEERDYYLFDTGIASAYLILRATEMGLTAHPISYYDESKAKDVMEIPSDMKLITIIVVGKRVDSNEVKLNAKQEQSEIERPRRLSMAYFSYLDRYKEYEENKKRFELIVSQEEN